MNDDFRSMKEHEKRHLSKAIEALDFWKHRIVNEGNDAGSKKRVEELDQAIDYFKSCRRRANEYD